MPSPTFPFTGQSAKLPNSMNRVRRWWKPALAVVALVVVLQAGVSLLVRTQPVHGYLIEHLARAFGRPVEVAHFNVLLLPTPGWMPTASPSAKTRHSEMSIFCALNI